MHIKLEKHTCTHCDKRFTTQQALTKHHWDIRQPEKGAGQAKKRQKPSITPQQATAALPLGSSAALMSMAPAVSLIFSEIYGLLGGDGMTSSRILQCFSGPVFPAFAAPDMPTLSFGDSHEDELRNAIHQIFLSRRALFDASTIPELAQSLLVIFFCFCFLLSLLGRSSLK